MARGGIEGWTVGETEIDSSLTKTFDFDSFE